MKFLIIKSWTLILLFTSSLLLTVCNENSASSELSGLNKYKVTKSVEWAKPGGQSLTLDIYVPQTGKENYPVLVIFHGGGWLINNNTVMDSLSTYIVEHSEYVVCNVNYRLLGDQNNSITMNQIVEDAMGAVLWVKENIGAYKGDKNKIIITGDSAGGHLAGMVLIGAKKLESDGFNGESLGFNPTFLPAGKTAEDIAAENGLDVQAAILSYPGMDLYQTCLGNFESKENFFWAFAGATPRGIFGQDFNANDNPEMYKAVSINYNIPESAQRKLPPILCTVGSKDDLIIPSTVKAYVEMLKSKGHSAELWIHEGRPHAFLDSWKNDYLGIEFRKDAPPAIDKMIEFMNKIFYK